MELSLDFLHVYASSPVIPVAAINPVSGLRIEFNAFVDTGADGTLFDIALAESLDLASGRTIRISGVGGEVREAKEVEIEVELLRRQECRATIRATFAPDVASTYGNLLGINVWDLFDLGLVHSRRSVGLSLTRPL